MGQTNITALKARDAPPDDSGRGGVRRVRWRLGAAIHRKKKFLVKFVRKGRSRKKERRKENRLESERTRIPGPTASPLHCPCRRRSLAFFVALQRVDFSNLADVAIEHTMSRTVAAICSGSARLRAWPTRPAYGSNRTSPLLLVPRKKPEPNPRPCNNTPPNETGFDAAGFTTLP